VPAQVGTSLARDLTASVRVAATREVTVMSVNPLFKDTNESDRTVKYDWGIYPAEPQAKSSIVTPVSDQRPAESAGADSAVRHCRYCTETLPPGARECPLCLREVTSNPADTRKTAHPLTQSGSRPSTNTSLAAASLTGGAPVAAAMPAAAAGGAVYTLESPAHCPECNTEIGTIHVIRVMRTQVSFTSTLPRKAYVIACPACRRLLSAGLSGLL
jgi:hypothetical protein